MDALDTLDANDYNCEWLGFKSGRLHQVMSLNGENKKKNPADINLQKSRLCYDSLEFLPPNL